MHTNATTQRTRYFFMSSAAILAAVGVASPALAQTAGSTLDVSAEVTGNCTIGTTPVAFGNVDVTSGSDVDATGGISVVCTSGTAWSASADAGTGLGASLLVRQMTSGAELLDYALYTDTGRTTIWGDGVGGTTSTFDGTGSGAAQASTIYARIPSGQASLPAGSYADTVTVTVTY